MTREQVDQDFADVPLKFESYWKYRFLFSGFHSDGRTIVVSYGGNADAIYRYSIDVDKPPKFGTCDDWHGVAVKRGDEELFREII